MVKDWLYFAVVQAVSTIATVAGWFLLIVPAMAHSWEFVDAGHRKRWRWKWLDAIYGNREDGVLPTGPVIWGSGEKSGVKVEYRPGQPEWLRAYMWSAWRNSADNLKYHFAWKGGPFYRWDGYIKQYPVYFKAGWNEKGLPVISAGSR